jgi:hypothetical protein
VTVFPDQLQVRVELAFGADLTGDQALWDWTDLSDAADLDQQIQISYGKLNAMSDPQPGSISLVLDNPDGDLTPDRAQSPYYPYIVEGTPLRFSIRWDGPWYIRFVGRVSSWEPVWPYGDLSDEAAGYPGEAQVIVTAAGILSTLEQNSPPPHDALRRHIQLNVPLAYWPLTDGEDARQGSEVAAGAQPMRPIGEFGSFYQGQPNWARGTLATWLSPVVELPADTMGRIIATLQLASISSWAVDHYRSGLGRYELLTLIDSGEGSDADPLVAWTLETDQASDQMLLSITTLGETTSSSTLLVLYPSPGIFDLSPHMIRLAAEDAGAGNIDWTLTIDGETVASGTTANVFRGLYKIRYRWEWLGDSEPLALGHITYWNTAPDTALTYQALLGHDRELAGRRIERLCAEDGVPLQVNGSLDDTPELGQQRPDALLDLLNAAADVDGGVLYESRDVLGLAYRTNRSKYNQGV